jgi:Immunoglobulin-like domain of bacterial spore germination
MHCAKTYQGAEMKKMVWSTGLMALLLAGCTFPFFSTSAPSAQPGTLPPAPLTREMLETSTYHALQYDKTITLSEGKFQSGLGTDIFSAVLQPEIAFGDLNADGVADAAVLLAENGGGSGTFVSVIAMLNQNGVPVQAGAMLVDDRPIIDSITIEGGKIILGATIHGPNDPMVSPSFAVIETYELARNGLALTHFTSDTPDGTERSITIDSPKNGDQVSGSVQVKGSMPIGPFENTLALRIYDQTNTNLLNGPFMINSDGAGGAATFDNPVDISSLPTGVIVRLELVEFNMADGSIMTMDSVELMIK